MEQKLNAEDTPVFTPFTATDTDFNTSARIYRSDLLRKPIKRLMEKIGDICSVRAGIRYEEKQYSIDANMEFGNYDPYTKKELVPEIGARTLRTWFGSVWNQFDPNRFYKTFLGSGITKGEGLKNVELVRLMLTICAARLGDNLRKVIFSAKHVDSGKTSATLFNGWDTITATEITSGTIATGKENLYEFTEAITSSNAVDSLKAFCRAGNDDLLDHEKLNLLVPKQVYYDYLEDYKVTTGAIPYNTEYKQTTVEGFDNVVIRPMGEKKNSPYIHLTPKENMLLGCYQMGDEETIVVEKHHPVLLDFFATLFFGVDFQSIDSDNLRVGKFYVKPS